MRHHDNAVLLAEPVRSGRPGQLQATVAPDDGSTINAGTVAFSDETGLIPGCEAELVTAGNATCDPTSVPTPGSHTITAAYSGDGATTGSTSAPLTQTVPPAPVTPAPVPPAAPVTTTPAPPVTTTPAPPSGSAPPVAVASVSATSRPGVIALTARPSSAAPGQSITAYAWYLGAQLIGRTQTLDYRLFAADARKSVTLRVTDSTGATATTQVALSAHVHTTAVSLSARTLFADNGARLTSVAKRLLSRLRAVILASPRVTIDGYTADGPQTRRQESWSRQLSARRAQPVKAFLFAGHVPSGTHLTVTGQGRAHDNAGPTRDRRSTIAYQRSTITIDR
jgi:outer membrane protein OmpA-like peptidoglycan-associated protein